MQIAGPRFCAISQMPPLGAESNIEHFGKSIDWQRQLLERKSQKQDRLLYCLRQILIPDTDSFPLMLDPC